MKRHLDSGRTLFLGARVEPMSFDDFIRGRYPIGLGPDHATIEKVLSEHLKAKEEKARFAILRGCRRAFGRYGTATRGRLAWMLPLDRHRPAVRRITPPADFNDAALCSHRLQPVGSYRASQNPVMR